MKRLTEFPLTVRWAASASGSLPQPSLSAGFRQTAQTGWFLTAAKIVGHGHLAPAVCWTVIAKCRDAGRIQECAQLEPLTTGLQAVDFSDGSCQPEQLRTLRAT